MNTGHREYTRETALNLALVTANSKFQVGKLIKSSEDFDWEDETSYSDGDPETIYSIASLYGQEFDNEDEILDELSKIYPEYI